MEIFAHPAQIYWYVNCHIFNSKENEVVWTAPRGTGASRRAAMHVFSFEWSPCMCCFLLPREDGGGQQAMRFQRIMILPSGICSTFSLRVSLPFAFARGRSFGKCSSYIRGNLKQMITEYVSQNRRIYSAAFYRQRNCIHHDDINLQTNGKGRIIQPQKREISVK